MCPLYLSLSLSHTRSHEWHELVKYSVQVDEINIWFSMLFYTSLRSLFASRLLLLLHFPRWGFTWLLPFGMWWKLKIHFLPFDKSHAKTETTEKITRDQFMWASAHDNRHTHTIVWLNSPSTHQMCCAFTSDGTKINVFLSFNKINLYSHDHRDNKLQVRYDYSIVCISIFFIIFFAFVFVQIFVVDVVCANALR